MFFPCMYVCKEEALCESNYDRGDGRTDGRCVPGIPRPSRCWRQRAGAHVWRSWTMGTGIATPANETCHGPCQTCHGPGMRRPRTASKASNRPRIHGGCVLFSPPASPQSRPSHHPSPVQEPMSLFSLLPKSRYAPCSRCQSGLI
jgi:hypothetical protein